MVKDMCTEASIGKKTNHSLRATGASAMFRANVPEKIIQKTTGHRSIEALRSYERVSTEQHKAVLKVLMSSNAAFGEEERAEFQQENLQVTHHSGAENIARLFGDLTNCTIRNLTVNVNPTFTGQQVEKEFDELVKSVDL